MSERRPQGPPPTPRNPAVEASERLMYTGETAEQFYARRKPLEDLWNEVMRTAHRVTIGKEMLIWK
ncbi:hypothetical protein J2X12_002858 [Pseudarthrobacter oxydans]|uniref:Uncharacterized protein n=1 Tax=Pseudarthrobacter oxydans TaxID=1671 RepID=A0AAW8ND66_PSEOX|nr:hypothetical protein [Pseudarthrobacter oxydans]MDR6794847.1 hypothetical protein [Pseudarthrobacter oxydans]MDR7164820.1 hypothetical protein [Pseudarthrobacter oxydans]